MSQFLIVGPAWVGDMVMAQSLFRHLKYLHPTSNIDVIAPSWTIPLLTRMPEVNNSHSLEIKHGELKFLKRMVIGKKLKAQEYSNAYVLPNSFKSALIPFFAGIPYRTAWLGEMRYCLLTHPRKLDKKRYPKMIERFVALAYPEGSLPNTEQILLPKLYVNKVKAKELANKLGLTSTKPIIAMAPGAEYGPAKKWPTEYYAEVAEFVLKQGFQVWLFGSANDAKDANKIHDLLKDPQLINLVGKTSLSDAIDLLSLVDKLLCNDSGLMHIANALGKSTLTPYGSTSTEFTPPLGKFSKTLSLDLWCRPCFKRECPYGHLSCLRNLSPKMVIQALELN